MARTKEAFEYKEEAENYVLKCVGAKPQTTHAITKLIKKSYFSKIHPRTVERLLIKIQESGKIKGYMVGRIKAWQK